MMGKKRLAFILGLLLFLITPPVLANMRHVIIGTGGVTGVYYPSGGLLSRILNENHEKNQLRVHIESTPGSVYNINSLMSGDIEFGVVQSDRQYQAYKGLKEWDGQPQKELRSLFSLHSETVVLVAAVDSGIKNLSDIKGHQVNIGNIGSGQRGNALDVLRESGLEPGEDFTGLEYSAARSSGLLQDKKIDAFFYTVGHPNASLTEATSGARKVSFIPFEEGAIASLKDKFPYYSSFKIPVRYYPSVENVEDVDSFGVTATFCTSSTVSEDVVYILVKELFENLDQFKRSHLAFRHIEKEKMLEGLTAPLHPGAERYYREIGLLAPQVD